MARIAASNFIKVLSILLLLHGTANGQREFTIYESDETVIVGNVTEDEVGRNYRFADTSPRCRETFTIDANGIIRTNGSIDREKLFTVSSTDVDVVDCNVKYEDNSNNTRDKRIQVRVMDINDNAPEFIYGEDGNPRSVQENMALNQIITVFTVKDVDKGDNGTVDYVEMLGVDEGSFYLMAIPQNGLLIVQLMSNSTIDFETRQQYNITLNATDRGTPLKSSTSILTINVQDVNEFTPFFATTRYDVLVEDTAAIGTTVVNVSATDADGGKFGIITYSITRDDSNGGFTVNSVTGSLLVNTTLVDMTGMVFTVHVWANNTGTSFAARAIVTITVIPSELKFAVRFPTNDPTYFFNTTFFSVTVIENIWEYRSPVWAVEEVANFTVRFNGVEPEYVLGRPFSQGDLVEIIFPNIDREVTPFISGTLTASSASNIGRLVFNITVLDENDNNPTFITTNFSIPENGVSSIIVGNVVAEDPDYEENGTVSYSLLNPSTPAGLVTLFANGSLVVNDAIDFEQVEIIALRVRAQDGGTPPRLQDETIYIEIENLNDNFPVISEEGLTQMIYDSTPLPFSWHVTASDGDRGEFGEVTLRVVQSDASNASDFVVIDEQSGNLIINEFPTPSSEPYHLVLEAVDGGNISTALTFTIYVWTDFCRSDDYPCTNGGICSSEFNTYRCECPETYGGRNCSILKSPCDNLPSNPCQNDGTCTNTEDQLDYRCTCMDSYSGRNCAHLAVSFKPRSFQMYSLPGVSPGSGDFNLSIQIAPKFLDGILLHIRDPDDFVTMELKAGRVIVHTPAGEEPDPTVVTNDGSWYRVTLQRHRQELSLSVVTTTDDTDGSDSPQLEVSNGEDTFDVFIGGLAADVIIPRDHAASRDYIGCMRDFFVNGRRVQLSDVNKDGSRQKSHNVEDGCNLGSQQSCDGECNANNGCINFLSRLPYCDCTLPGANCKEALPTVVSFTGEANLIVETKDDFFIASQQSRHAMAADELDVKQTVEFHFSSRTLEAVLLSGVIRGSNNNLGVFWFDNHTLNYDVYENKMNCVHLSVIGNFSDEGWHRVRLDISSNNVITLSVDRHLEISDDTTCQNNLFVALPSTKITITGRPAMDLTTSLPVSDFHGCISDLKVDDVAIPLAKEYNSELVVLREEGSVDEVHDQCVNVSAITSQKDDPPFIELYIVVVIVVVALLVLVLFVLAMVLVTRRCLHHRPNKSRFDMSQEMPDYQESPPGTLTFRKKTEFDNASVGHYQEEGEETMPDAAAISFSSLRKSAVSVNCNSSTSGTCSGETGFHTGSERDRTSDISYPEPATMMVNEETASEVQESEYSTFVSDSDNTSAVEQTLSPPDIQLLGPPKVLGIPSHARNMARKPPSMKDPTLSPLERKVLSPYHPHGQLSRFSMSTIESGSESSLGPPTDPMLDYSHQSSIHHEPQLPGLKTLCGPDFNPISYWEQQSRLKPSIDPDYPLQRLSLASGRGTEDPSSTISIASTLEEQHEFASQGGGEGEATNMRDGLESDHELDYRLADLHIAEYESMTLSQSTLVGGSEDYFPDATVKPCHSIVGHDSSIPRSSPFHHLSDHKHSPTSIPSSSTLYEKSSRQRLLSDQDLSTHNRYYGGSRTVTSAKPTHMISDHRLHGQYSNTSTSSESTSHTARAWRSQDPVNV